MRKIKYTVLWECTYISIIIVCIHTLMIGQQDPMFTKYMLVSDMLYNPASTARNGKSNIGIIYRNQWLHVQGAPTTSVLSYENSLSDNRAGIGINLFHDNIGFDSHIAAYLNYAYRFPINEKIMLSMGLKGGVSNYRSDFSKVVSSEPTITDPLHAADKSVLVPRIGSGISLHTANWFFGFSIPYFSAFSPKKNLIFEEDNVYLSKHYYLLGGYLFDIPKSDIQLKPTAFFKYHKSTKVQIDLGIQGWYKDLLGIGFLYRTSDAFAAVVDLALYKNFVLSYSYDYTYTDFRTIGNGAHEIMLFYQWQAKTPKIPSIHKVTTLSRF